MGGHLTDLINIADRADLLEGAKIKKMSESLKTKLFHTIRCTTLFKFVYSQEMIGIDLVYGNGEVYKGKFVFNFVFTVHVLTLLFNFVFLFPYSKQAPLPSSY